MATPAQQLIQDVRLSVASEVARIGLSKAVWEEEWRIESQSTPEEYLELSALDDETVIVDLFGRFLYEYEIQRRAPHMPEYGNPHLSLVVSDLLRSGAVLVSVRSRFWFEYRWLESLGVSDFWTLPARIRISRLVSRHSTRRTFVLRFSNPDSKSDVGEKHHDT